VISSVLLDDVSLQKQGLVPVGWNLTVQGVRGCPWSSATTHPSAGWDEGGLGVNGYSREKGEKEKKSTRENKMNRRL